MIDDDLIKRIKQVASDPDHATDEGHGITDSKGNPIEYVAAPPIDDRDITAAESQLNIQLPPLLRRLYAEVGNGGFGPGYGLLALMAPVGKKITNTVISVHQKLTRERSLRPDAIPICDWGSGIYSCLDLSEANRADARIVRYDHHIIAASQKHLAPALLFEAASLHDWFEHWLDGDLSFEGPYGLLGN